MSFHTSAVCDGCERHLDADNEEAALEDGWLVLRYGTDCEETTRDFCSMRCLLTWASHGTMTLPDPAEGLAEDGQ